ncbi:MAG: IMP dehydrogenase [Fervidicoccaceae archaeon]
MPGFLKKLEEADLALSFEDVLLLPSYSDVSFSEIETSTLIPPSLKLSIPILSSPMDTVTGREVALILGSMGGLGVLPRNILPDAAISIIKEARERGIPIAAAVGPRDTELARKLIDEEVSCIVIDSAHGHSKSVIEMTAELSRSDVPIISGNIVTADAALALVEAGASGLRVGIGPGHACTTREIAGIGCPQLTAIARVADAVSDSDMEVAVIADGGFEKPADLVKAIAVGADAIMLGYLIASSLEAPGERVELNGKCYKRYRGMGSQGALQSDSSRYGEFKRVPEGVEGLIECRGSLSSIIDFLLGGLKQGMGYVGARNLSELKEKAKLVRITPSSFREGGPRGMLRDGEWDALK